MREGYYTGGMTPPARYNSYSAGLYQIWELKDVVDRRFRQGDNHIYYNTASTAIYYAPGVMTDTEHFTDVLGEFDPNTYGATRLNSTGFIETIQSTTGATDPNTLQWRYTYLYEKLDPLDNVARTTSPAPITRHTLRENVTNLGGAATLMPMGEYINVTTGTGGLGDPARTPLITTTYRDNNYMTIIANGNVPATAIPNNMSGIIIAQGDVTLAANTTFNGLILAGGRIRIGNGAKINANRAIVQAIIDEELREESKQPPGTPANAGYAVNYFRDIDVQRAGFDASDRITGTDYTSYISFARWMKGEL
jgi:hypothetical protein